VRLLTLACLYVSPTAVPHSLAASLPFVSSLTPTVSREAAVMGRQYLAACDARLEKRNSTSKGLTKSEIFLPFVNVLG
jgi:hypothetical protein